MELTLIPIAAILVLLAGLTAPAQPALQALPSTAMLSLWLRRDRQRAASAQRARLPARRRPGFPAVDDNIDGRSDVTGTRAQTVSRRRSRPLLRTRFGITGGAYRPMAPPARA